ncbi:MAG: deoxyribose-phosphate aldolase [Oscillospiraceae bacterium]
MNNQKILSHVDHTLLKAVADRNAIDKLCQEAIKFGTASVCIPPSYVAEVHLNYPNLNICTVIGFPLGYSTTAVKVFEAMQAVADGANEIDMVINLGDVKNGEFNKVTAEISQIKLAIGHHLLKVIVETCYLTEDEKISLCHCVTDGGADYIKTSTGFGTSGAMIDDVILFGQNIGKEIKIKAAGGIKTKADLLVFLEHGCERIGASGAIEILRVK